MFSKFPNPNTCVLISFAIIQFLIITNAIELPDHMKKQAKKLHDRCQKQTGVNEEIIHQSINGNVPDDGALKCYVHCFFDMIGMIDEAHIVHLEYLKDILPAEAHDVINNLVEKCGTQKGSDGCETAFKTMMCYYQTDPKLISAVLQFIFN